MFKGILGPRTTFENTAIRACTSTLEAPVRAPAVEKGSKDSRMDTRSGNPGKLTETP